MSRILVYNTCIKVTDYNRGDSQEIEDFFSIEDKTSGILFPKCIDYDEKNKVLTLPRGMDIDLLSSNLNVEPEYMNISDPYDKGLEYRLSYLPRDNVQKEAINFIIGRDRYSNIRHSSQLGVNLNTGAGKTYVTICSSTILAVRTIMITSSIGWINQWRDRILEYTDTAPSEIFSIIGSTSIALLMKGMVNVKNIKYFLASHQTLHSFAAAGLPEGKEDWTRVTKLFKILRVGLKVYDEAHLNFDNIWKIDFNTNTAKTLYLTATPARSANDEDKIYQMAFKNMPKIDLFNEERDRRTRYIAVFYNSHPLPGHIRYCSNRYGFDRNRYCNYIMKNEYFYKIFVIIMEIILKTHYKTLIYIGTNKAILQAYNWIMKYYPELSDQVGIYTSIIDKSIKEEQLNKMIILSTTKSCGAAIDIHGLKMTVVLAEPFKSKVLARQSLGRTRDRDTTYIEVVDYGFDAIKGCYQSKLPVFAKYATDVFKERLSKEVINPETRRFEIDDTNLEGNYKASLDIKSKRDKRISVDIAKETVELLKKKK